MALCIFILTSSILIILPQIEQKLYARALIKISAGTATSIMSTNSAIVYSFEWILLGENFRCIKTIATALAINGVVIISFDSEFLEIIYLKYFG